MVREDKAHKGKLNLVPSDVEKQNKRVHRNKEIKWLYFVGSTIANVPLVKVGLAKNIYLALFTFT